ncbi:MAG: LCP family protein [Clostridia bacterium]|nr:LCP family protein [Clostridia bacterium]MBQ1933544.1 LCP family protein [Clostridia bacterium]MBQ5649588.1 LCP family protein [Clostridia bacterium]MBR0327284.1 LCP family protein [Clostridia bacterium]
MENENKENRDKANTGEHITKVFAVITNNNALKKHQSKRPDYLKVVLLILVALTLASIFTLLAIGVFYRPSVDTGTPFDTSVITTDPSDTGTAPVTEPGDAPTTDAPKTEDVTQPGVVLTRNKKVFNFLVMGLDKKSANTDVIMIVNLDVEKNTVNVVQLPRDTYIRYDGKGGRINTLYAHYWYQAPSNCNSKEQCKYAMEKTAESIEAALCIQIDYYALVYLDVFKEVVDGIGGVYMNVPYDMYYVDDTPGEELYVNLKAGPQTLNGSQAEQFIRYRSGYITADIGRLDAQKMFISAMLSQLKSSLTLSKAVNVAKSVIGNTVTDVSVADAQYYIQQLAEVDLSKIMMLTMAGEGCQMATSGAWMYSVNRAAALDTVNKYLNVYYEDIPDSIFDSGRRFTNDEDSVLVEIYESNTIKSKPVSGENAGDIDIPRYEN